MTRTFVGHDDKATGRKDDAWEAPAGEQRARDVHVGAGWPMAELVAMPEAQRHAG